MFIATNKKSDWSMRTRERSATLNRQLFTNTQTTTSKSEELREYALLV